MSKDLADKCVDKAYRSNERAMSFYERMIIAHVILTVFILILSIVVEKALAWVEVYAVPVLGYFIYAHRKVTLDNPNILDKANDTIGKANDQEMMKQNLIADRLEQLMKRKEVWN